MKLVGPPPCPPFLHRTPDRVFLAGVDHARFGCGGAELRSRIGYSRRSPVGLYPLFFVFHRAGFMLPGFPCVESGANLQKNCIGDEWPNVECRRVRL
jgi:hypothetical protein